MKTISVARILSFNPCADQRALFLQFAGKRKTIPLTLATCKAAAALGLDLNWAAQHLFPAPIYAKWDAELAPIYAKWNAERAPIYAQWNAELAPINAKWNAERPSIFYALARKVKA